MDINAKTVFAIWMIGIAVTLLSWVVNLTLSAMGVSLSLETFSSVFISYIILAFIFGLIVHGVDELVTEQKIEWMGSPWSTAGMLWLIGIVASVLIAVVTAFLNIFGLSLGFSNTISILGTVIIIPLAIGFVCNRVDTWITGD